MKTQLLTLAALLLLSLSNCSPEDNDSPLRLPPITTTGENTFGCYIDGKLLIPRDGSGTFTGPDKAVYFWGDPSDMRTFSEIDVHDFKSSKTGSILIHIQNLDAIGVGEYVINESNGMNSLDGLMHNYIHCRVFSLKSKSYQYYRSFSNSGVLKILNYNLELRMVSGTFSCSVVNSANPEDIIQITDGRFDFKWDDLPNKKFP